LPARSRRNSRVAGRNLPGAPPCAARGSDASVRDHGEPQTVPRARERAPV
jgi:hypothetical protein